MGIAVGRSAPDFTLRDQHGGEVTLATFRGRPVVLVFYPFAFSNVCTGELTDLRDRAGELDRRGAVVLALSCDPVYALRVAGDRDGVGFSLLSDFWPHGAVASAYDVFDDDRGCARRSTYVVDGEGRVAWAVHNPSAEARDIGELLEVLDGLPGPSERSMSNI